MMKLSLNHNKLELKNKCSAVLNDERLTLIAANIHDDIKKVYTLPT